MITVVTIAYFVLLLALALNTFRPNEIGWFTAATGWLIIIVFGGAIFGITARAGGLL